AQRIIADECDVVVAGGVESITAVQDHMNSHLAIDPWMERSVPEVYLPMLRTAEVVAERYGVDRDAQDAYGVRSHQRAAAAQSGGLLSEEIVPIATPTVHADRRRSMSIVDVVCDALVHDERRGGAVGESARVSGSDGAAGDHGAQRARRVERRVGPDT